MLKGAVFVVGTRAQLIKIAPVITACERRSAPIRLLMTGQHKETIQDLMDEFGIRSNPISAVEIEERSSIGSLLYWLPSAYLGVERKLREFSHQGVSWRVVVHGDTLSTLIGATAARRLGLAVVHIESGLTSGSLLDPFPEEICRRLVFRFAELAMCPNPESLAHMQRNYRAAAFDTKGNTIVDAVGMVSAQVGERDPVARYVVASLHRFQNIYAQARLKALVNLLLEISRDYTVYFVLHPATRKRLESSGLMQSLASADRVVLSPRLGYGDFLRLVAGAACVLTDGGSNQEELAVLGVPTLVMRSHTERPDGLGDNAIMESDAPGGVLDFVRSAQLQSLRRPPVSGSGWSPSEMIADHLLA